MWIELCIFCNDCDLSLDVEFVVDCGLCMFIECIDIEGNIIMLDCVVC